MTSKPWEMGLEPNPFERMKTGKKVVEYRLDNPKWKSMAPGDQLVFLMEPERIQKLHTEILEIIRRETFEELLEYVEENGFMEEGKSIIAQVTRLERRYPVQEREQYPGVLGIRVQVISHE